MLPSVWEACRRIHKVTKRWQDFYPLKLLELWDILQREKPERIVEFGSGYTTAVCAEYALATSSSVVTIDENREYQQKILGCLDCADQPYSEVLAVEFCNGVCRYRDLARDRLFDLAYIDGPDNTPSEGQPHAPCVNVCELAHSPSVMVFDIRQSSVEYAKEVKGDQYLWADGVHLDARYDVPWYLSSVRHHTVARRGP